jgi:hypothetical protein
VVKTTVSIVFARSISSLNIWNFIANQLLTTGSLFAVFQSVGSKHERLNSGGALNMDTQISRRVRAGLIAASLSAALMIGGAAVASAQQQDQDRRAPEATPSQSMPADNNAQTPAAVPQTAPDQDNGVRPTPDKDRDMQPAQADRDQAKDADRDHDKNRAKDNDEAWENSKAGKKEMNREVKEFDKFLDSHPNVAKELRQDPQKINDQAYVSQHPELNKWLEDHSNIRREIQENPSAFMNREKSYEKSEGENPKH